MAKNQVPIWEKYMLSLDEASSYFRLGKDKLRQLAEENRDAEWLFFNGNRTYIKREKFEKTLDKISTI